MSEAKDRLIAKWIMRWNQGDYSFGFDIPSEEGCECEPLKYSTDPIQAERALLRWRQSGINRTSDLSENLIAPHGCRLSENRYHVAFCYEDEKAAAIVGALLSTIHANIHNGE